MSGEPLLANCKRRGARFSERRATPDRNEENGERMFRTKRAQAGTAVFLAAMLAVAALSTGVASATQGATSRPIKGIGIMVGPVDLNTGAWDVKGPALESPLGLSWAEVVGNLSSYPFIATTTALNGAGAFTSAWASDVPNPTTVCPQHGFLFNEPYENIQTITGGTGRFAGATGTLDVKGCFGVDSRMSHAVITFTSSGTISY